jgi:predicted nucleotidyltransferase
MVERTIIENVRRYLVRLDEAGIPAVSGIIFGSAAHGSMNANSDIDVIVLSPSFDGGKDQRQLDLLWRIRRHVDSRIEPIAIGLREYEEDNDSPIMEIARREGVPVRLKNR